MINYFDMGQFIEDIKKIIESKNATQSLVAAQSNLSIWRIKNLLNSEKCTVDTFVTLCNWANLEPTSYFIKYSR